MHTDWTSGLHQNKEVAPDETIDPSQSPSKRWEASKTTELLDSSSQMQVITHAAHIILCSYYTSKLETQRRRAAASALIVRTREHNVSQTYFFNDDMVQ